jgi:hypothetical protein
MADPESRWSRWPLWNSFSFFGAIFERLQRMEKATFFRPKNIDFYATNRCLSWRDCTTGDPCRTCVGNALSHCKPWKS